MFQIPLEKFTIHSIVPLIEIYNMKQSFYVFICFNLLSIGLFAQGTITYGGRGIKPYQIIASDQAKLNLGYNLTK
ncbi:MAG: hypothetical protein LW711_17110 [Saprospiraceae bacterium]|nr:hypothetical protein [Saprospiraceae bacterium]